MRRDSNLSPESVGANTTAAKIYGYSAHVFNLIRRREKSQKDFSTIFILDKSFTNDICT